MRVRSTLIVVVNVEIESMQKLLSVIVTISGIFTVVPSVMAESEILDIEQLICGPRETVVALLANRHGEHVIGRGLTKDRQTIFEIFKSKSGSWTATFTDGDDISCLLERGDVWLRIQSPDDGFASTNAQE